MTKPEDLLAAIATQLGAPDAVFSQNGLAFLPFLTDEPLEVIRLDDQTIDVGIGLTDLTNPSPAIQRELLVASCLGISTGNGYMAVENGFVSIRERWACASTTPETALERLESIMEAAGYWLAEGCDRLLEKFPDREQPSDNDPLKSAGEMLMLRL